MRPLPKWNLAVCAMVVLSMVMACRHQAVTSSLPNTTRGSADTGLMQLDQVNTEGWDKAWTNLLNVAEQTFTPSVPRLLGVEVELVVGNPGNPEDELTLTILDESGQVLATVTREVRADSCERVMFAMPNSGVELSPGEKYWIRLTGGPTFGWKYMVGGYQKGEALFNRKPLLAEARSTFLFRTYGGK